MSRNETSSPGRVVVLVAALIAGLAVGVFALRGPEPQSASEEFGPARNIVYTLGTAEAIAIVDSARPLGDIKGSENWSPVPGWQLDVVDVLYVASESREATDEDWDDLALSPVPMPVGTIEALGRSNVDLGAALQETGQLVVFLSAPDPAIFPDLTVPWKVVTVAQDTPNGMVFYDSDGLRLTGQWHDYIALLGDTTAVGEAESRVEDRGEEDNRIPEVARSLGADPSQKARERELAIAVVNHASTRPFAVDVLAVLVGYPWATESNVLAQARDDAWHAADPSSRALDHEITPQEVLKDLEEWRVLLDLPEKWDSGEYVEIRTPTGVADAASVDVGPHPTSVLARPSEPWMVYLTQEPGDGGGTLIGTLSDPPSSSVGAVLLSFAIDSQGGASVSFSDLTAEQVSDLLASWAG